MARSAKGPSMGPEPVLISRTQIDALYTILEAVAHALDTLQVPWILTGGSLLGSVRQHSILFTDDDVDLAIIGQDNHRRVAKQLPGLLGDEFQYAQNVWEGGDRVRWKRVSNVFVDVFVIREYADATALRAAIGRKANGQPQEDSYIEHVMTKIHNAANSQGDEETRYPCWHFAKRKAIELWPKEVYRRHELFPIQTHYTMGPIRNLPGPRTPVVLLQRAFGTDCFDVYYQSVGHGATSGAVQQEGSSVTSSAPSNTGNTSKLPPRVQPGGLWEQAPKTPLQPEHYIPIQPVARSRRRPTDHSQASLQDYLRTQMAEEARWMQQHTSVYHNDHHSDT